jgi:hypothetical protein
MAVEAALVRERGRADVGEARVGRHAGKRVESA